MKLCLDGRAFRVNGSSLAHARDLMLGQAGVDLLCGLKPENPMCMCKTCSTMSYCCDFNRTFHGNITAKVLQGQDS